MSKQKRFKQKLKNPRQGFVYYRLWGWPLRSPAAVSFHIEKHVQNQNIAIIDHPTFGWLHLAISSSPVDKRIPACYLNGTINNRYFKAAKQGRKVLADYANLREHAGLADMFHYHSEVDSMESFR